MKLFSKKLIGLLVCLALVLAMLPMAVFAADTYVLEDGVTQSIAIAVGDSVTIEVDATASDMTLVVNGDRMYYDWYVDTGRAQSYPNPGGMVETVLPAGSVYTLTIVNVSEDTEQVVDVTASAPVVGTEDTPAELVMGENTCYVEAWGGYFYTWTATEAGSLTIAVDTDACSDWTFVINGVLADGTYVYGDTVYSDVEPLVSSQTLSVNAGDVYTIMFGTASYEAGTVVFNASFEAGAAEPEQPETPEEPEIPEEPVKEEYVISEFYLGLGDNVLTLDPSAVTTIYEFCPDEAGVYTFTADDPNALVGYWGGGSFFVFDQTENKSNVLEFTLTNAGPSIMVGISGVETVTLNVEKTAEYIPAPEIPVTVYVNTHTFIDFSVADDAVIIDFNVVDDEADVVVLGADGFYHYGSADGDLVVTDLKNVEISIIGASEYGQLTGYVYDENGERIEKIDYNAAMVEYAEQGLYPVTEELATMIQRVGESRGWWDEGGFVIPQGQSITYPDMAWLAFCSYVEGMTSVETDAPETPDVPETPDEPETPDVPETPDEPETPDAPETPEKPEEIPVTADASLAGLVVAMMLSGAAIVCMKKKEF